MPPRASRGEVWYADLNPARGHEQAGERPVLIVSTDVLNHGPSGHVVVIPLTRTDRGIRLWVAIDPPEGGLRERSFAMCDSVRSISSTRLRDQQGVVGTRTMEQVEDRLRIVLQL